MKNPLKEERKRLDMTHDEIAELCGVTRRTVIYWESGTPIPSDKLYLLKKGGFDIDYILTGEERTNHPSITGDARKEWLLNTLEIELRKVQEDAQKVQEDAKNAIEIMKNLK